MFFPLERQQVLETGCFEWSRTGFILCMTLADASYLDRVHTPLLVFFLFTFIHAEVASVLPPCTTASCEMCSIIGKKNNNPQPFSN